MTEKCRVKFLFQDFCRVYRVLALTEQEMSISNFKILFIDWTSRKFRRIKLYYVL